MSGNSSKISLKSSCSSIKNKAHVVPRKKIIIRDQIVSSKFVDTEQFIPSYIQTKSKPEIYKLLSMEYAKVWQDEHNLYEKSVIDQKFVKDKRWKLPTFQTKSSLTGTSDGSVSPTKQPEIIKKKNIKNPKPKSVWK